LSPANKKRVVVYGLLGLVVLALVGYKKRGLLKPAKPVKVVSIGGESPILPVLKRASAPGAGATTVVARKLRSNGAERLYMLVSPAPIDAARKYPLVLVMHGDGGTALTFHAAYPFEQASGADAFLAYPDGIHAGWDLETLIDNRDVRFIEDLVEALATELPIDRKRVYGTGYSSGGFFLNLLACRRSGLLRAFTSSAGGAPYNQPLRWPNGYPRCLDQKPVPMIAMHGERDFGVTLDSGRFSAEYWAYVNGCDTGEMETTGYPECHAYRRCKDDNHVAFCSVPGLGHWVWQLSAEASWTFFNLQK
jgi:polyhydroxybutyrate depolymerase